MLSLALIVFGLVLTAGSSTAAAAPPPTVRAHLTDTAGVLGADRAEVADALSDFTAQTGFGLYAVYVDSFDNLSGTAYARKTAARSGLGTTDILLAIATDDRDFGVATPTEHVITQAEFAAIAAGIQKAVAAQDWSGAAVHAAHGYAQAASDSGLPWPWIVTATAIALLAGAMLIHNVRRRYDRTHVVTDEHGRPIDPLTLLRTDELIGQAHREVTALPEGAFKSELAIRLDELSAPARRHQRNEARRHQALDIVRCAGRAGTATTTNALPTSGVRH